MHVNKKQGNNTGLLAGDLVKNLNVLLNYFIKQQLTLRFPNKSNELFMDNMQI